jgi:translation initiation factor 2 subunit 3
MMNEMMIVEAPFEIKLSEYQEHGSISTFSINGHVAHGKTELTRFLTSKDTKKFGMEKVNGCTVKMGHANLKIYYNKTTNDFLLNPKMVPANYKLIRHFSISDNPGHNSFMTAMIVGTSTIDNCLFLIAGDKGVEAQTHQHMKCFKSTGITNFAVVISKIDLVPTVESLKDLVSKIDDFMDEQKLDPDIYDPKYIPLSSFTKVNTDALIKYLVSSPYPKNIMNLTDEPFYMSIMRSFDINKPGTPIFDLQGAVFGGSIEKGFLTIGDVICILPGKIEADGNYTPLITQVVSLKSDTSDLQVALPGGFVGISTTLDPLFAKSNAMVGNVIVKIEKKEDIDNICSVSNIIFVSDVVNLNNEDLIEDNDYLLVIHGSEQMAKLVNISDDKKIYKFILNKLVACMNSEKVAILTKIGSTIDIASFGKIHSIKKTDNIVMDLAIDIDEYFANLPIKKTIKSIKVINDIETFPEFEDFEEELALDTLLDNINFDKKKYNVKYDNILLDTNTTSVIIKNAGKIMSVFTNDSKILMKLCFDLATHIKVSMDLLEKSEINVDGTKISFDGLRNTRRFIGPQFSSHLSSFIELKFTCKNCNAVGSVFFECKKTFCKACNATLATKD